MVKGQVFLSYPLMADTTYHFVPDLDSHIIYYSYTCFEFESTVSSTLSGELFWVGFTPPSMINLLLLPMGYIISTGSILICFSDLFRMCCLIAFHGGQIAFPPFFYIPTLFRVVKPPAFTSFFLILCSPIVQGNALPFRLGLMGAGKGAPIIPQTRPPLHRALASGQRVDSPDLSSAPGWVSQ